MENLKSCLRVLTKLHGTVLAYKHHVGGTKQLWEELKELKEPALMKVISKHLNPFFNESQYFQDILGDRDTRKCVKRNYLPFLKYLEISDPSLVNYTTFLANISNNLFHTFLVRTMHNLGLGKVGASWQDLKFGEIEIDETYFSM